MKAVIHQPYFLPWMGYFSKLVYANKFIVLDNINFTKRKFLDRTQVISSDGRLIWIGIPIGEHYKEKCNGISVTNSDIVNKVIKTLYSAYSKARHFEGTIEPLTTILKNSFEKHTILTEINLSIIKGLIDMLELNVPEIILSSQFHEIDDATERIIMLLKETNCSAIITGSGGSLSKHDLKKISDNEISILVQDYFALHPTYYQTRRTRLGFAKGLSIVDCILNEGILHTRTLLTDPKHSPEIFMGINK